MSLAHFLIGLLGFVTVEFCKFFVYATYLSFVSDTWFADISLQYIACLFILNRVFCRANIFNFGEVLFTNFLLLTTHLVSSLKSLLSWRSQDFSSFLPLNVS